MTKYTFSIENVTNKGGGGSGCYFDIVLTVDGTKKSGRLKGETWFQGCGLNALQGFTNVSHWPVECVPDLLKFLAGVTSSDPIDGTWYSRRYVMSLTTHQLDYSFVEALTAQAEKLSKFRNLAHGPQDIHLFLLTTQ